MVPSLTLTAAGYQVVKQPHLTLTQVDFQSSNQLTKAHIKALWDRYDLEASGFLQANEIRAVICAFLKKLDGDHGSPTPLSWASRLPHK